MNKDVYNLNSKVYSNNYNLLAGIVTELQNISECIKDSLIIKRIGDIIIKMNNIINENKKNTELIINHISSLQIALQEKITQKFDELIVNKPNNINQQELKYNEGKYIGEVANGLREGRGTMLLYNGDIYEGDWKNDKAEGKGIYYFITGDKFDGDWINGLYEGKGILYYSKGNRYEGDWKNGIREGEGILYYNNGDREIGNFSNDQPVGKHVILTKNGDIDIINY
jgi:hypothetical protein